MASTFTLKRKTYTAWDYRNEIADYGFKEGFDWACEKMFGNPVLSEITNRLRGKHGNIDEYAVKAGLRRKKENFGQVISEEFSNDANREFNKMSAEPQWKEHCARARKMLGIGKQASIPMTPNNYGRVA